jgi:hypothetical protein
MAIREEGSNGVFQNCGFSRVEGGDALSVLDGERRDGRHPIAAMGSECFQVRSDSSSGGGIEARYAEDHWQRGAKLVIHLFFAEPLFLTRDFK